MLQGKPNASVPTQSSIQVNMCQSVSSPPLQAVLDDMGIASSQYPEGLPERAIFCSRTLNLRAIKALGYDMGEKLV